MSEEAVIPAQFTHSVKLSETAKGIRVDVHVYANSGLEAMREAIALYQSTKDKCKQLNIPVAPMEVETK